MGLGKQSTYNYKFKDPRLGSLHELVSRLHPVYKINFGKDYGNFLGLLSHKVDPSALLTVAQFYDPPMRCFTFQYFQIAPMLEEFEHLVRILVKNKLPFVCVEESLKHEVINVFVHMYKKDVTSNLETKGKTKGFPLKFLIEKAYILMDAQSWEACYVVIALAIYGIMLLPNLDDFVDVTDISIFLKKNLVPTL